MKIRLKFLRQESINRMGMLRSVHIRLILSAALLVCAEAHAAKKKKAAIPVMAPESKTQTADAKPAAAASAAPGGTFQELDFNRTLVIEGKVEKPQVQFTLLKEPPPEKEIQFETSFLPNILKLDRENTFKAGETYGRE